MSAPIKKLRLGPLPKTETIKLTFACTVRLKCDLDRYATLHGQTYGEAVDVVTLIPHMLEAFMAGDRAFAKNLSRRNTVTAAGLEATHHAASQGQGFRQVPEHRGHPPQVP